MNYEIRKLKTFGKGDFKDARRKNKASDGILGLYSAVYSVNCTDFACSRDAVVALLDQRFLRSTDLVKIDGCWMTLADSPQFGDAAEPHARHEARIRWLKGAGVIALFIAYFVLRVHLHPG